MTVLRPAVRPRLGRVLLFMLLLGLAAGPSGAGAREAAAVPGRFNTSLVVANLDGLDAGIEVAFYDGSGAARGPLLRTTVPAGASRLLYVPTAAASLPDGRYSAVVRSERAIRVVANLSSDAQTATAYNAVEFAQLGTSFSVPSVYRAYYGFTSALVVQHDEMTSGPSESVPPANVTVTYRDVGGAVAATETAAIPNRASVSLDLAATAGLPDGFAGSATIASDRPVGAVFLVSGNGQLSSGAGSSTGARMAFLPALYHDYAGYRTNVQIQNVDTAPTSVRITYFDASTGRSVGSQEATVQAGSAVRFDQYDTEAVSAVPRRGFNGSAIVESTDGKNILAVANVQHPAQGYLEAYRATPSGGGGTRLVCASILKNYFGYSTSLSVQNLGGSGTTDLTITYADASGAVVATGTVAGLPGGATHFRYNPNDDLPNGFNGSAMITSSSGGIAAVVNELLAGASGDQLLTYNCSPVQPSSAGATAARVPLVLKNAPVS